MRRMVAVLTAAGALVALPVAPANAKLPPACVQKTVGPLHFQVGYCP